MADQPLIVVTGGAGFIGSNLVAALNHTCIDNILIVDRLGTDEKWMNLRGLRYTDFLDKEDYLRAVVHDTAPRASALFHLGACSATTERDADYLLRNNYAYSRQLCEWALRTGARFIVASSAATYGDGTNGYSDDDAVTPSLRPLNMYGYSKQMFDEWALGKGHYRRIVGLKFFNVYGPGEAHKGDMRSVVHKAYHEILETGAMSLFRSHRPEYPDGGQMRDFVFVRDAIEMMLHFLDHPDVGGLYNCGTGKARTWLDLAHAVFAAMNREPRINWIDMPAHLAAKYQYFTEADMRKTRSAGYTREFTPIEDGIRAYIQWLQAGNT